MQKYVISATALIACAGIAHAAKPQVADANRLGIANGHSGQSTERASYSTGFEAGEGFGLGALPQGGWTGLSTLVPGLGSAGISNVNPFAGSQNLRVANDNLAGYYNGGISPQLSVGTNFSTTVKTFIPTAAYADYYFGGLDNTAYFSFMVHFTYLGDIRNTFNYAGAPLASIVYNQYVDLTVSFNNGTIGISYNGSTIYSGASGFTVLTTDHLWAGSDNFQDPGEAGDFDNASVTPAPGAAGLLGLSSLVGLRRRR